MQWEDAQIAQSATEIHDDKSNNSNLSTHFGTPAQFNPSACNRGQGEGSQRMSADHRMESVENRGSPQLKEPAITIMPHKSHNFFVILDLFFWVKLKDVVCVRSVNEGTTIQASISMIDQLRYSILRIIQSYTNDSDNVIFVKYNVKDGCCCLD